MKAESEDDNEKLRKLVSMARIGWWEADFNKMIYRCSPFVSDLLGLEGDIITFEDFRNLICEEYRERIIAEFNSFKELDVYEQIFPMHTKYGIAWVSTKVGETSVAEDGSIRVLGMLQYVSKQKMNIQEKTIDRLNTLLYKQNSISRSLLTFIQTKNITEVINNILKDILNQLNGNRVYIFEYDKENGEQNCIYHITSPDIPESEETSQSFSMPSAGWWSKQLLSGSPVILFNLDKLPGNAEDDRRTLDLQNVKSVMAHPLSSQKGIWGYIRIDVVNEYRDWNNEDYLWFASLADIISICMELLKSEEETRVEKVYLDNLYKHMPVGYIRLKRLYKEGIPVGFILLDSNKAYGKIFGDTDTDEYNGKEIQHVDLKKLMNHFLEIVNTDNHKEVNFHVEKTGKICHSILYSPQRDEVVAMFSDMTETFKAHEALDRSEKILRNIYKNLPIGIELYDKDGYLININDKELEIFGLNSIEDVIGVNIFENPVIPNDLKDAIKKGKPIDFSFKYNFGQLGNYYNTSNKGIIDIITKITPLYDSSGNLINYLFINIDNTETNNAYSKIQEFESFFTLVGQFAKVGYAHFNAITRDGYAISSWFRNVGEKEGTPLSQIIGVHSHFHPDDRAMMLAFLDKVLKGEATNLRNDMRIMRSDGHYTWTRVNVMVKNFCPEEGIIEMVCINYDITELKETEFKLIEAKNKAESMDRLKSAFLANMSHEIRTPLNAIVGFSDLLIDAENIEERKQYISIVKENNELLLQLISDILDLSKIEAGTFDITKGEVDVNLLCNEIAYSQSLKASPGVGIVFENYIPDCHIWGDKNRINQILTNFITNAIKFTTSGSISLGYHLTDKKELKFYVRDTGTGIPADKLDSIFDRFVKLNTFVHGTGLGLSICKSIVEQMGGTIGVESTEGEGSCFWFTHSYIKPPTPNVNRDDTTTTWKELPDSTKPKILIAEDTDSNYLLVSSILRKDYELKRAYNGNEVIELHSSFHPDIILMDVKMPETDGFEATIEIRKKDKSVPIIAVTAYAFDRDRQKSLEVGCNDYLSKPISAETLKETITKWLQRK